MSTIFIKIRWPRYRVKESAFILIININIDIININKLYIKIIYIMYFSLNNTLSGYNYFT